MFQFLTVPTSNKNVKWQTPLHFLDLSNSFTCIQTFKCPLAWSRLKQLSESRYNYNYNFSISTIYNFTEFFTFFRFIVNSNTKNVWAKQILEWNCPDVENCDYIVIHLRGVFEK